MQDAGYDCIGCNMKLYNNPDAGYCSTKTCCSLSDVEMPAASAPRLGHALLRILTTPEEIQNYDVMEKFARSYTLGPYSQPLHRLQPVHQV